MTTRIQVAIPPHPAYSPFMSGGRRWILVVPIAVLVTALLAGVVTWVQAGAIQRNLTDRARAALVAAGMPTGNVSFDGRDATLSGFPPWEALRALDVVQGLDGVRAARFDGDVVPVAPSAPPTTSNPPTSSPPPPTTSTTAPPPTDKAGVQAEIDRILAETPISFAPGTTRLTPEGEQAARDVAVALAKAPADFRYRVTCHVSRREGGASTALKLARAVARVLTANGLTATRVTYRGLSDTGDKRVEITVV
ncbi:OmpA family protein [Amycolatopsis sp. NPDC021455]|uniref:OmpA family protein n=1 Tax=Amycolatopsis sp. NPDC021455 TaxID=3154901 RepID=UPI0033FE2A3E